MDRAKIKDVVAKFIGNKGDQATVDLMKIYEHIAAIARNEALDEARTKCMEVEKAIKGRGSEIYADGCDDCHAAIGELKNKELQ